MKPIIVRCTACGSELELKSMFAKEQKPKPGPLLVCLIIDYRVFAEKLGLTKIGVDSLTSAVKVDGVSLRLGWAKETR